MWNVEGHGVQVEDDPFLSVRAKVVGYTPRVRMEILLQDGDVDSLLDILLGTRLGVVEHGVYWVTAIEQNGRL